MFRLQQDLHAWNVDGSSTDQLQNTSWIKHWEEMSGLSRRRRCAFSDCDRDAEHGGHVWIKGHASQTRGVWIAPICKQCNYCEKIYSDSGMHADSTRSFGKVPWLSEQNTHRTWQTPSGEFHIPMTARNMIQTTTTRTIGRNKFARLAVSTFHLAHLCDTPNAQIAFALVVQQAFAVTLSIVSKSLKPNTEHKRPRGESDGDRTMPLLRITARRHTIIFKTTQLTGNIGKAIARKGLRSVRRMTSPDRPANHSVCLGCYSARRNSVGGTVKMDRGRRCEGCGGDISDRPANHSVCLGCYSARRNSVGGTVRGPAEGGAKDAAVTSPIDRRITLCVLVATAPAGIVLGVQSRGPAEGGAKGCGGDISDRPANHSVCLGCYSAAGIVLGVQSRWIAEGGAKDAVTSPMGRRITLCVLVATAPAGIVLGVQSRGPAEGGAKDAAVTYQLDLPVIHGVTLAIEDRQQAR